MWPWGHLAVGYVCYSLLVRLRWGRAPGDTAALAVAFGTQFPDLIDKPLAWSLQILPSGRSLAHSLLTAALVIAVVGLYCRRRERSTPAAAFGVGYLSHLLADALSPLLGGEYVFLTFLAWPLTPPPPYGDEGGFLSHFVSIEFTPFFLVQIGLLLSVLLLWVLDGTPGLEPVRSLPTRLARRTDLDR
jgi:membrane-bound metal-dependent hydrolase YbcI (DUF457 family)